MLEFSVPIHKIVLALLILLVVALAIYRYLQRFYRTSAVYTFVAILLAILAIILP